VGHGLLINPLIPLLGCTAVTHIQFDRMSILYSVCCG